MSKLIVFVNPWIYDFAAYDLWAKPMGLLYLASYLARSGYRVHLIDCLDIYNPYMKDSGLRRPKRREYGTGKLWKQKIETPPILRHIKRPFSRYGITPEILKKELLRIKDPSAFIVTSIMTYWYLGVRDTIRVIREIYPDTPILLGGIYTRLCTEHAKSHIDADMIITSDRPEDVLDYLIDLRIYPKRKTPFGPSSMYPAFELYKKLDYVCIMTSKGCPFRCSYCAGPFLNPVYCMRDPDDVFEEICYWKKKFGVMDFAFYDDALLLSFDSHLLPLLEMIIKKRIDVRFHTPNAIHITEIDREVAEMMYKAGFKTIRLGLETIDIELHKRLDRKIGSIEQIEKAVSYLFKAGFRSDQIGAYILIGLPNQDIRGIIETLKFTEKLKIMPFLAEYSPIPHTPLWDEAVEASELDIKSEPLYHNNILIPCWNEEKKRYISILKRIVRGIREKLKKLIFL